MKLYASIGYLVLIICSSTSISTANSIHQRHVRSFDGKFFNDVLKLGQTYEFFQNVTQNGVLALRNLGGNVHPTSKDGVLFYLYNKANSIRPKLLEINSMKSLQAANLIKGETVFITHGWIVDSHFPPTSVIRDAYLAAQDDRNIIVVDWGQLSLSLYHQAVAEVGKVGNLVARMIRFMRAKGYCSPGDTTLVGHSLGAHVMGVAGKILNGNVKQIFGLDPALPFFENPKNPMRLSRKSATHVQVIHTNANQLGLSEAIGHADFYPNGGSVQPGCEIEDAISAGSCSHGRAFRLFAESITSSRGFEARKCQHNENAFKGPCTGEIKYMGGRKAHLSYATGVFYLRTGSATPFAFIT